MNLQNTNTDRGFPPLSLGWLMWGLVALLYLLGFFQRMAPAVMVSELMRDFAITGALMGNLSATYFYSYALMQIPSGLLADRIGPRRLATYACLIFAIGQLLFAWAPTLTLAYLGRLLIGASVAVAFVTCMKLAGHWFPTTMFATVTGVSLVFGNIGGVLARVPLAEAVATVGWRSAMAASGVLTVLVAATIWLVVRDDPSEYRYRSHAHASAMKNAGLPAMAALRSVVCRPATWLLFFAGGFSTAPVLVFAGLWGVPYLTQVHGLGRSEAATMTSVMLIAWAIGGPSLGALSDRLRLRRLPYLLAVLVTTSLWAIFLWGDLSVTMLYPLLAMLGFFSGAVIIGFAFAREVNHPGAAGATGGVVNMSVLGFAAILQPLLGLILDRHWHGALDHGVRLYDAAAYQAAFLWFVVSTGLAVAILFFTKESHCRASEN